MKPLLAVIVVLFVSKAQAQGISLLAMCHPSMNCSYVESLYKGQETIYTGWLEQTFSPSCKCADRLLRNDNKKVIRVHLMNSPCMRNRRCGRSEALWGYDKVSASRAAKIPRSRLRRRLGVTIERFKHRLAASHNTLCYVSPCLECDLNDSARRTIANLVSLAVPHCVLVDNPHGHRCIPGQVCEYHGSGFRAVAPCITDLDGLDGRTVDLKKWVDDSRTCDIAYYWEPWMNCNRGKFVNPRRRDCVYPWFRYKRTKDILCHYFWRPLLGTC